MGRFEERDDPRADHSPQGTETDSVSQVASPGRRPAIVHVVSSINIETGGPAMSVPGLAAAQVQAGGEASVVSLDYPALGAPNRRPGPHYSLTNSTRLGKALRGWSPGLEAEILRAAARGADAIHNHGLWMFPGIYARRAAERLKLPLVISPRGMLDEWSLERGSAKKALASALYEDRNLLFARLLHATSELEAASIRSYGLKQPIAILPNGIDSPLPPEGLGRDVLERRFPELVSKRWLLFLGRLDPKKGLDTLTSLWSELSPSFSEWILVVAGPDLRGFGKGLKSRLSTTSGVQSRVIFTGMLEGREKHVALAHAELLVLPTRSENFGISVAEALIHGTPALTTTAAPWSILEERGCGWWVAPERESLGAALKVALNQSPALLQQMGEIGAAMARERFAWRAIGESWIEVYRWLNSGGDCPRCVVLD